MKKVYNVLLVMILSIVLMVSISGCAEKSDKSDDKKEENSTSTSNTTNSSDVLVAEKEQSESGIKYTQRMEISFKDGKAYEIKAVMVFEDESIASLAGSIYEGEEGFELNGKELSMKMKVDDIAPGADEDELTREYFEKELKDEGYTIK